MCTSIFYRLWAENSKQVCNGQGMMGPSDPITRSSWVGNSVCLEKKQKHNEKF